MYHEKIETHIICQFVLGIKQSFFVTDKKWVYCGECGENFHKLNQHTHSLSVTNNDLSWQKNLIMVMFQLMSMSSYDNNKLHFCSVTQHQCRHHQMWGKLSQIHPLHSHFICYKNELSCLNNLFIIRLQLIRMSSYAKTKLQMCSVTQHQCRCRQMWSKVSQIHRVHSLFVCYKK